MLFERIHLENGEKIITTVRRHWIFMVGRTLGGIILTLLPLAAALFFQSITSDYPNLAIQWEEYTPHLTFLFAAWMLFNWMSLAYAWTDHYLDIWTITDRRIIKIDQIRFFSRSIGSFRLERLQDVNVEIDGFFATLFDYGTIEAQTASGSEEEFRVHHMPNPRELKSIILNATDVRMQSMRTIQDSDT